MTQDLLAIDALIPLLQAEHVDVRHQAARILADHGPATAATKNLLWEAYLADEQHPYEIIAAGMNRGPMDEATFLGIIERLTVLDDRSADMAMVQTTLDHAPVELIRSHRSVIDKQESIWPSTRTLMNFRTQLQHETPAKIWQKTIKVLGTAGSAWTEDDMLSAKGFALAGFLIAANYPSTEVLIQHLAEDRYGDTLLALEIVDMLGYRMEASARATLLRTFHNALEHEDELLADACTDALARCADAEVIAAVHRLIVDESPLLIDDAADEPLSLGTELSLDILGNSFLPQAVSALVSLFGSKASLEFDCAVAARLALFPSPSAVDEVLKRLPQLEKATGFGEVVLALLPMAALLGIQVPERERLEQLKSDFMAQRAEDLAEYMREEALEDEALEGDFDELEGNPSASHILPYVRVEAKVGRNDPCHCGSGKKYKKCCML
jgi:hypothetical protein